MVRLQVFLFVFVFRCLAKREDLDGSPPIPRNHEHTKLVMQSLTSREMWKKYGIVDNILVSYFLDEIA